MIHRTPVFQAILISILFFLTSGCLNLGEGTREHPRFYLLQPLCKSADKTQSTPTSNTPLIGIEPVKLPDFLNRPQMVTRISDTEVRVEPFARWATPLGENIASVLSENLSALLGTDTVVALPWGGALQPTYRIQVRVISLIGKIGEEAQLEVQWTMINADHQQVTVPKRSQFTARNSTSGYSDLVTAQSQLLADFSREVSETIRSLP